MWKTLSTPALGKTLLMLAPRRGHSWLSQAPIHFPESLRFHVGQSAPGQAVAPSAISERKFLPVPISHLYKYL